MHRTGAGEGLEQQPHGLLDLLVGIEHHPPAGIVDQAHRQAAAQLAAARLVQEPAAQARPQHMQLRLAHRSLEAEQQPVVEVRRVVDPVLVQDQRVGQRADLEQPVPVGRVARQPRDLQPQHDPGAAQPDLGHQPLKAGAVHRRGPRLAEIRVDHDDALPRPAEGHGALAQRVLTLSALGVLDHLPHRRLPHVQVRLALEVTDGDLGVRIGRHGLRSAR